MRVSLFLILCVSVIFATSAFSLAEDELKKVDVIAFSRYTGSNWQIWVKNLDTKEERRLTFSPTDKRNPQWAAGSKKVFYRTANSEIFMFDIEKKIEKRILHRFGTIMDQTLSKDGKRITFARLRPDLMDDSDIWVSDLSGKSARCLTNEVGLQYCPAFSPDANQIAFVSSNKEGGQTVHIMDSDGKNRRGLTRGKFFDVLPSFSPDAKYILFSSNRGGNYDIWQVEVANGRLKQLTKSPGIDTSPVFSTDGKKIAFVSSRSGTMQIWSMNKDGKNVSMITQDNKAPSQDPTWTTVPESHIFSSSTFAEEDKDIEKVKALLGIPGDFNMKVEVEGKEGQGPVIVDGTTTFVISKTDATSEAKLYKFYYFFDGGIRRIIRDASLPYKFKQTYRGLSEGSYELGFVLIDASGSYGSCKVSIYVRHEAKK